MTFEELLGGLPRQTQEQWAARAEREWRGRSGAAFAKTFGRDADGAEVTVGPFAATSADRSPVSRPARPTWTPLSDLRPLGDALTVRDALAELAGGAQGFCLDAAQLPPLAGSGEVIRYDYLTLDVHGGDDATAARLAAVIPEGQRAGASVTAVDMGHFSLDGVAAVGHGASLPVGDTPLGTAAAALSTFERGAVDAIAVPIPSDYLDAVTLLGTADLLWANVCAARGADLSALGLHAHVRPSPGGTPEAYLIDASVRALAAVSAGVDALTVTPYSASLEHRRQARNVQQLMLLEAGLAERPDVLTGAAWFEEAVVTLARAAWEAHATT